MGSQGALGWAHEKCHAGLVCCGTMGSWGAQYSCKALQILRSVSQLQILQRPKEANSPPLPLAPTTAQLLLSNCSAIAQPSLYFVRLFRSCREVCKLRAALRYGRSSFLCPGFKFLRYLPVIYRYYSCCHKACIQ